MTDDTQTIAQLKERIKLFVDERQWQRHHRPKNLATSIMIEAAELLEHFQWDEVEDGDAVRRDPERMHQVGEEMADVLAYLLSLANALEMDLAATLDAKIKRNAEKYPVDACLQGKYSKYSE